MSSDYFAVCFGDLQNTDRNENYGQPICDCGHRHKSVKTALRCLRKYISPDGSHPYNLEVKKHNANGTVIDERNTSELIYLIEQRESSHNLDWARLEEYEQEAAQQVKWLSEVNEQMKAEQVKWEEQRQRAYDHD